MADGSGGDHAGQRLANLRRVVTGHDDAGRSVVMIDGPCIYHGGDGDGWRVQEIWQHDVVPAPIPPREPDPTDGPLNFIIPDDGVRVRITDFPPTPPGAEPFMHRTNSVDYLHVLEGEITMLIDGPEREVVLRKGDTMVQRATDHAWVNRSGAHCRVFIVMVAGRITPELESSIGVMQDWDPDGRAGR